MSQLHQINMEYQPVEDRLVLKVNTTDRKEVRLWFTRRFTKQFWDALLNILEQNPEIMRHQDDDAKKAMMAFQQENVLQDDQFKKKFDETAVEFPLGQDPVLVTGFQYQPKGPDGVPRMVFQISTGSEMGVPVNDQIIHSFVKLLMQVSKATGWDLSFEIGFAADEEEPRPAHLH